MRVRMSKKTLGILLIVGGLGGIVAEMLIPGIIMAAAGIFLLFS